MAYTVIIHYNHESVNRYSFTAPPGTRLNICMDVIQKIDLDLSHMDWTKVRQMYDGIENRFQQGLLVPDGVTSYGSQRYRLGREGMSGSVMVDQQHTQQPWVAWCGRLLEDMVPELNSIGRQMKRDGLDFVTLTYNRMTGPIGRHADGKPRGEATRGQCNINYIIGCSDAEARTHAVMPDGTMQSYDSLPDTAWCLDTSVPHWVECSGEREFIQMCVHEPLDRVVDWFHHHSNSS